MNSIKSKDKVYKISKQKVLNRYFFPYRDGENVFPTFAFKTSLYNKYWEDNKNYISVTIVSIITLIVSAVAIYLLISIFN